MSDLYLDPLTHDLVLSGSDLRLTDTDEILIQRLKIRLEFLLGEWFLNVNLGIPYTQIIFEDGANNLDVVYFIFSTEIRAVEGVDTLDELTLTPSSDGDLRLLNVACVVNQNVQVEVQV